MEYLLRSGLKIEAVERVGAVSLNVGWEVLELGFEQRRGGSKNQYLSKRKVKGIVLEQVMYQRTNTRAGD